MRRYKLYIAVIAISLMVASCGVDGDPGHCFLSIKWEYYNEDYRVFNYEDNNPDIPDSLAIEAGRYYDCYPGVYEYSYESKDSASRYEHIGIYKLEQNPGTPGGFLHDGLDGADTRFELYLYVIARKGLNHTGGLKSLPAEPPATTTHSEDMTGEMVNSGLSHSGRVIHGDPLHVEYRSWEQTEGEWSLRVEEEVRIYKK